MKKIIVVLLFLIIAGNLFAEENEFVNKIGTKLVEYMENTEDFLTEQTPDYVEQLLKYDIYRLGIWTKFFVAISVILLVFSIGSIYMAIACDGEYAFWLIFLIPFLIAMLYFAVDCFVSIKQIEIAPKVYILEHLRSLL